MAKAYGFPKYIAEACLLLKNFFRRNKQIDSAFVYQELAIEAKDTIFAQEKIQRVQNLKFNEQLRQMEIERTQKEANLARTKPAICSYWHKFD